MANIRRHRNKWQVQIRRSGIRHITKSFRVRKDAEAWARQMEVQADRHEPPSDPKALQRVTLANWSRDTETRSASESEPQKTSG
jgi:hypothetical protein